MKSGKAWFLITDCFSDLVSAFVSTSATDLSPPRVKAFIDVTQR